jgi:hypothetical protein
MYINGGLADGAFMPYNANPQVNNFFSNNYIGHDSFNNEDNDAFLDDLKIFNRELSEFEIIFDMKNSI